VAAAALWCQGRWGNAERLGFGSMSAAGGLPGAVYTRLSTAGSHKAPAAHPFPHGHQPRDDAGRCGSEGRDEEFASGSSTMSTTRWGDIDRMIHARTGRKSLDFGPRGCS
jgi:hypothetical protein